MTRKEPRSRLAGAEGRIGDRGQVEMASQTWAAISGKKAVIKNADLSGE